MNFLRQHIQKDKKKEVKTFDLKAFVNKKREEKINNMFDNVDNGFLNTKTIYKVKNHE